MIAFKYLSPIIIQPTSSAIRNDYSKQVSDYFSSEFREVNVK